jgi:hypothetical protein
VNRLFSQYRATFLRGTAEILIIVVGVLIALAVDEWRANIASDRLANQYMERLRDDLRRSIDSLERGIFHAERGDKYGSWVIDMLDKPSDDEAAVDLVVNAFWASLVPANPEVYVGRRSTYEDLLATSGLTAIPDLEIRILLSEYYYEFDRIASRISGWSDSDFRDWTRGSMSAALVVAIEEVCDPTELALSGCPIEISNSDREFFLRSLNQDKGHIRRELNKLVQYWRRHGPILVEFKVETEELLEKLEEYRE